jgi:hypothetical protein
MRPSAGRCGCPGRGCAEDLGSGARAAGPVPLATGSVGETGRSDVGSGARMEPLEHAAEGAARDAG